jgi:hypothetical protein
MVFSGLRHTTSLIGRHVIQFERSELCVNEVVYVIWKCNLLRIAPATYTLHAPGPESGRRLRARIVRTLPSAAMCFPSLQLRLVIIDRSHVAPAEFNLT